MDRQIPIGILGGTFDPIHKGHIDLCLEILEKTGLGSIRFLPCYQPVHRGLPNTSPQHRVNMIQLAIQNHPQFTLDTREINRKGASYTIDTVVELRQEFPSTPLCLLIGQDAFNQFNSWKDWQQILKFAHIIVVNRAHFHTHYDDELQKFVAEHLIVQTQELTKKIAGYVLPITIKPIPISATEIRSRIKNHQSIDQLVPKAVADYIKENRLYNYAL